MEEIRIRFEFAAPRTVVFDAVGDHERFLANAGTRTAIAQPGSPERNGKGCVRVVRALPGIRFVEEIISWDPPSSFAYMIRESSLPIRHDGGTLTFTEEGATTVVSWVTRFACRIPLASTLAEKVMKKALDRAFRGFLEAARRRLSGGDRLRS